MGVYEKLLNRSAALAVIGLGYVGLPLAAAFSKHISVIGFDINNEKIRCCIAGSDPTGEIGDAAVTAASVDFTSDEKRLSDASFFIAAVPTPINQDKTPNLSPVISASELIGCALRPGAIVVYESTVYPGVTEEICVPILEKCSGLKCGMDFKVGYSPERINPGDKVHRLENIIKIVSGCDAETLNEIAKVYELIIDAGVYRAPSIRVAEAAKVAENSQRDMNIAFMNELAIVFDKMGISTPEVIAAMNTKWNALGFYPGLVGGHCIGVDPYYFVYKAEKLGYHSQIILAGRKINDSMSRFVTDAAIKEMILADKRVKAAKVAVLGITFKENCPDCRNSKAADIITELRDYGIEPIVYDPVADAAEVKRTYNIELADAAELHGLDCVIFAVAHREFQSMTPDEINGMFGDFPDGEKVVIDVRSMFDARSIGAYGCRYRSL